MARPPKDKAVRPAPPAGESSAGASSKKRKADHQEKPKTGVSDSAASAPVKSIMSTAMDQDFPRGAPAPLPRSAKVKPVQIQEDKGLFDDGMTGGKSAAAPAPEAADGEVKEKKRRSKAEDSASKKRKISSTKATKAAAPSAPAADAVDTFRVEHLSYKRLLPGPTVLLVQVVAILPLEIIVSLPNMLLGHIPITNISKTFTKRLEENLEESDDEESEEEESEEEDEDDEANRQERAVSSKKIPSLSDMFQVGQYLRASVVKVLPPKATTSAATAFNNRSQRGNEDFKGSRRCELSLEPPVVNAGISLADMKTFSATSGIVLQAEIKSVEDNGYVLDLGTAPEDAKSEAKVSAFVSFKEEKLARMAAGSENWPKHRFTLGGIVSVRPLKVAENGRTCTVSILPSDVEQTILTAAPNIGALLPGTLVSGTITANTHSGLNIKFLGFFDGSVDPFHKLAGPAYKVGSKISARILWTAPPAGDAPTRFSLSVLPHIVALQPRAAPTAPGSEETAPLGTVLPIGTFLQDLEVRRIENEWGLLCLISGTDLSAFVHISHAADDHLTTLAGGGQVGKWKVGTHHKGRVIGYSAMDGLLQVSLQESVLNRKFMKVADLQVGAVLEGTVQRLSDNALFVNIQGNVAGIVWPLHYSDLRLKHPERKFKPGGAVKTRVLSLDAEKNRVVLTLKRSLVNTTLPVLPNGFDSAEIGLITNATVHTFLPNGKDMLVELWGGIRAYVPVSEASDKFVDSIAKVYTIGQVVAVKITKIEEESRRLTASVKQAMDNYEAPAKKEKKEKKVKEPEVIADVSAVQIGQTVSAKIEAIHEQQVVLTVTDSNGQNIKGLLTLAALAKHRDASIDSVRDSLSEGETLKGLNIVSKNPEKGLLILACQTVNKPVKDLVTGKTGISSRSQNDQNLFTFETLSEGQILQGTLGDANPQGYFVQLSQGIRGKLRWSELGDDYDQVQALDLKKGAKIQVVILEYDQATRRIDLSARGSRMGEADQSAVRDPILESMAQLEDDKEVRGFVKGISDNGVFVDIGKDLSARVQIKELFDEYIKDWKPRFEVGQLVSGKILSTNAAKKQIEMTLRKTSSAKRTKKETGPTITFEGLQIGQVIKGVVKRVEKYGAFIRIEGSGVSGLCHKSEISDDEKADWQKLVSANDSVRAVIIDLDVEKRKLAFSMKPSKLPEAESEEEAEAEEGDNSVMRNLKKLVQLQEAASDDEEADSDDDEDWQVLLHEASAANGNDSDEEAESDDDEEEDEEESDVEEDAPIASTSKTTLKVPGFSWDGQQNETMDVDEANGDDSASEAESDAEEAARRKKNKGKGILVDDQTGELANQLPTSSSDFERLLLGSPNSSYLWIQYMSYYLQLSDIEKAREIGERALKTINYREEDEKLNVWLAIINLENTSGTDESLEETFNKAVQQNDAKQVYLRTLQVYEATAKYDREEQLFERFVKKFNVSSKAWTLYGQFLLDRDRGAEARELLPRSLKSLPKRKHVKTISQFALMEFKSGEAERGRTIFEGIVDTYPKRLDLWWIYIDQEIRVRNVAGVRALFDRVLGQNLSSKKTKSLLKKWLAFEKEHGDDKGADAVKQRAVAYVERMQGA